VKAGLEAAGHSSFAPRLKERLPTRMAKRRGRMRTGRTLADSDSPFSFSKTFLFFCSALNASRRICLTFVTPEDGQRPFTPAPLPSACVSRSYTFPPLSRKWKEGPSTLPRDIDRAPFSMLRAGVLFPLNEEGSATEERPCQGERRHRQPEHRRPSILRPRRGSPERPICIPRRASGDRSSSSGDLPPAVAVLPAAVRAVKDARGKGEGEGEGNALSNAHPFNPNHVKPSKSHTTSQNHSIH